MLTLHEWSFQCSQLSEADNLYSVCTCGGITLSDHSEGNQALILPEILHHLHALSTAIQGHPLSLFKINLSKYDIIPKLGKL